MNVYHGSYTKIEEIDLSKALPSKDFGKGFYVTKYREHAEGWAKVIGRKHKTEGFVTEFVFYDTEFTERLCKVKSLLTLQHADRKRVSLLSHVGEPIVEKLVTEFGLDEKTAADKFFSSNTFSKLADTSSRLYEKNWVEIYDMLKKELAK
jgi:hypothetical protein